MNLDEMNDAFKVINASDEYIDGKRRVFPDKVSWMKRIVARENEVFGGLGRKIPAKFTLHGNAGFIRVDQQFRTTVPGLYAVGLDTGNGSAITGAAPQPAGQRGGPFMSLPQAYECLRLNLFDSFHCLITRTGGIGRAARFCDLIETARRDYQICNMDNSIAGAAAAHFAVSRSDRGGRYYDELGLYLYLHGTFETDGIQDDIVKEQAAVIKNGTLYVPKGPGLGVELDEDMMKKYAAPGLETIIVK